MSCFNNCEVFLPFIQKQQLSSGSGGSEWRIRNLTHAITLIKAKRLKHSGTLIN